MGDEIEIKLNKSGFRSVMSSGEMQSLMLQSAQQMEKAAEAMSPNGVDYMSNVQVGKVSAHGLVGTTDAHSMKSNAKRNSLRKAIDAGRV